MARYRHHGGFLESALAPEPDHFPIAAILDVVLACSTTMMAHLSIGSPVRGGIDVALGLYKDRHVYTAATVKAVALEKCATFPRILIGERFRDYLESFFQPHLRSDKKANLEATMAASIQKLLYQDPDDGFWGVDYLGERMRQYWGTTVSSEMVAEIGTFAREGRTHFRDNGRAKEEGYYDRLIRYVDSRLTVWGIAGA